MQAVHYRDERPQYYFSLYKYSRRSCGFVVVYEDDEIIQRSVNPHGRVRSVGLNFIGANDQQPGGVNERVSFVFLHAQCDTGVE